MLHKGSNGFWMFFDKIRARHDHASHETGWRIAVSLQLVPFGSQIEGHAQVWDSESGPSSQMAVGSIAMAFASF